MRRALGPMANPARPGYGATMNFQKTSGTESRAPLPPPSNDQIAALAHALWIDRGRPEGGDLEHWYEAERQLRSGARAEAKDTRLDPATAPAARIERALDRVASPPAPRSPTSL